MVNQRKEVLRWVAFRDCRDIDDLHTGSASQLQKKRAKFVRIARRAGYKVFGSNAHQYSKDPEDGYTVTIIIGQSAMIFHTYPEKNLVTFCSVTCPEEESDTETGHRMEELLAKEFDSTRIDRSVSGEMNLDC